MCSVKCIVYRKNVMYNVWYIVYNIQCIKKRIKYYVIKDNRSQKNTQ